MALRVLLADESTTIKKVMQLALQDFAVEVKAVQSGTDVAEVARSFKPDIVFIDVLLPKKNGYEASAEVKGDKSLNSLPVVLMWSSFMDIDETAFDKSRANGRLEKPFDVESLRSIVKELVPKTQTQRLAHFLQFPADFVEPVEKEEKLKREKNVGAGPMGAVIPQMPSLKPTAPPPPAMSMQPETNPAASSNWNMDNFEPLPDVMSHFKDETENEPMKFAKLGGPKAVPQSRPQDAKGPDDADPWAHQDLNRFKLDIPEGDVDKDEISIVFDMNEPEPKGEDFLLKRPPETTDFPDDVTGEIDPMDHTQHQIQPIGKIKDVDGGMISQFDPIADELPMSLSLEDTPEAHPSPSMSSGFIEYSTSDIPTPPQMNADELERVIRAQSREVIEAVVQRVVPEIARELIKKEIDRLMGESARSGER